MAKHGTGAFARSWGDGRIKWISELWLFSSMSWWESNGHGLNISTFDGTRTLTDNNPATLTCRAEPVEEGACQNALEVEEEACAPPPKEAPQDAHALQINEALRGDGQMVALYRSVPPQLFLVGLRRNLLSMMCILE